MVENVDGTNLDKDDTILTLGMGNVEAERAAALSSLKARLGQTETALEMERRARKETEQRLKTLEQQLEQDSCSNSVIILF